MKTNTMKIEVLKGLVEYTKAHNLEHNKRVIELGKPDKVIVSDVVPISQINRYIESLTNKD